MPDGSQCIIHHLPMPALRGEGLTALLRDTVVLASATGFRRTPLRFDVSKPFQSMQQWVEHPVRPFQLAAGHLADPFQDGVVPSKYSVVVVSEGLPSFAIALGGRLECPISSSRR